jgi:hypothetical protein
MEQFRTIQWDDKLFDRNKMDISIDGEKMYIKI